MTAERKDHSKSEQASEIIRNLYLARFTQHAMRCVSMSLASSYMDADISDATILWEETAAYPLLKLATELQHIESELVVNDTTTLIAYSDFVQLKARELVENAGTQGGLKAKWLPEILSKCREVAVKGCLQIVGDKCLDVGALDGLSELAAAAYSNYETSKLRNLEVHLTRARAFTLKAIELFTVQLQELHQSPKAAGFSYFERVKEFAPVLFVATSVYALVADEDVATIESQDGIAAQIRKQFSVTDKLSQAAQAECNQMLELCLSDSLIAGNQALGRQLEAT